MLSGVFFSFPEHSSFFTPIDRLIFSCYPLGELKKHKSSRGRKDLPMEMESENRKQIRNLDGKLICETIYDEDDEVWCVYIKHHGCLTLIQFFVDGGMIVSNSTISS